MLNHAFPALISGGFVGVDIFFVISGYLISGHIFEALNSGTFSLLDFYIKRVRRIFPALILVLLSCLAMGWFCLFSREYAELGQLTSAGAFFLSNIVLWKTTGYFDTAASYKILLHLWSLGIEEQYYIFWPLFVLLFRRILKSIFPLILIFTIASFALNVAMVSTRPTATFYLPLTRFWELLIGVVLAYLGIFRPAAVDGLLGRFVPSRQIPTTQSVLGVLCLLYGLAALSRNNQFPGWWALLPTLGTFLLISAGPEAWINRRILSHPFPVFIGMIGYPLYLWHWPLLVFLRILSDGTPPKYIRFLAMLVAVVLAWLTYRFVEVPIRFRRVSSRSRLVLAVSLLGVLASIGVYGYAISKNPRVLSARFGGADYGVRLDALQEVNPECKKNYPFATDFCQLSHPEAPPTVALFGDSHAIHFYGAMKSYFDHRGENLLALAEGDCLPFYDVNVKVSSHQAKNCPLLNNRALDQAMGTSSIHTIILSAYSVFAVTGTNFALVDKSDDHKSLEDMRHPRERSNATIYRDGLRRTVKRALEAKKQVVFVLDTPELDFEPSSCVVHRPLSLRGNGLRQPCSMDLRTVYERQSVSRKLITDTLAEFPEVKILDPLAILCHGDICLAGMDGTAFYLDRNHLLPQGADYLVERFSW